MDHIETSALETKSVSHNADISAAFDEFMGAFSAFKEANDERLKSVENMSVPMC
jgi:hypothetical protein